MDGVIIVLLQFHLTGENVNMFKYKRIVLDCDGVLADFVSGLLEVAREHDMQNHFPSSSNDVKEWNICEKFLELFTKVKYNNSFWLNLPVLNRINFTPMVYLTARPCSSQVTAEWLKKNKFPKADVITVKNPLDKIHILKELECDLFIDDHIWTIKKARDNGINAHLFKQPYQSGHSKELDQYNLPIIYSLGELNKICQ